MNQEMTEIGTGQIYEKSFNDNSELDAFLNSYPDDFFSSGDYGAWMDASIDALLDPLAENWDADVFIFGKKRKIEIKRGKYKIEWDFLSE
jgi:hypothetical protein